MSQHVSVTPLTPGQRLAYADDCHLLAIELWYLGEYYSAEINERLAVLYSKPE